MPAAASWTQPATSGVKISLRQRRGSLQTGVLGVVCGAWLLCLDLPASDGAQLAAGPDRARSALLN